jgi:IS5 family transposase
VTTILDFRHLIEQNDLALAVFRSVRRLLQRKGMVLKKGTMVDVTIIDAPTSTKNEDGKRDPEVTCSELS